MFDEVLVKSLFEDAVRRSGAFGAQLSLSVGDRRVDFVAGSANEAKGLDMTVDTAMQIGSITKVFTATLVMSLAEQGKLDIDKPVRDYLPGLRLTDPLAARTLTPAHLMSMTSGLDNGRYLAFGPGPDALGRYVDQVDTLTQHFPPGRQFGYSNASACISGHLAATLAGTDWETLLADRIIGPAGLASAVLLDEDMPGRRISQGHTAGADGEPPTIVAPLFSADRAQGPSGACFALATRDLARFGRMFLDHGVADTGARILRAETVERMMTPRIDLPTAMARAWCLGLAMHEWDGLRLWGHSGGTQAGASWLQVIPDRDGVIAFNVNTRSAFPEFQRIMLTDVLSAAFGVTRPRIEVPDGPRPALDPTRYVGTYEKLGMTARVTGGDGGTLDVVLSIEPTEEEMAVHDMAPSEIRYVFTPLGGDRFLMRTADEPDGRDGAQDAAFVGAIGDGRPASLLMGPLLSRTTG